MASNTQLLNNSGSGGGSSENNSGRNNREGDRASDEGGVVRVHDEPLPPRHGCNSYIVYKVLSIIYSVLFVIIGLLMIGIGVWIIVIKEDFQSINDVVFGPVLLLIIVGVIIVTTAFIGCIGATCDRLWSLRIFLAIVIFVFLVQVVIGIIAYVYREETIENFGDRLKFVIDDYGKKDEVTKAVDKVQRGWKCCGIDKAHDWSTSDRYSCTNRASRSTCHVPDSCCTVEKKNCGRRLTDTQNVNMLGCKLLFRGWVERNLDAIGATALTMAILHILGIFAVYLFITTIEDRRRLFKYRKRYYSN